MASEIRELPDSDLEAFAQIMRTAFLDLTMSAAELAQRLRGGHSSTPFTQLYGFYRDGALLGGMRHHDFTMSFHGTMLPVGGVAMVAVDLLHKRQQVAKELIGFYLRHYRARGVPLAALYAFRPDFYRQMGFGYGGKHNLYRVRPDSFPRGARPRHLRHLSREDLPALLACYHRQVARSHGLFLRHEGWGARVFDSGATRALGYVVDGEVQGYLLYTFLTGKHSLHNDLEIRELVYEHPAALAELCTFLHTQADQVTRVVFSSQDDQIHHLLYDPRNDSGNVFHSVSHETNAQGVGIMYRVIDLPGLLAALAGHNFGGQSVTLAIDLRDSFLPEHAGPVTVQFRDGRPHLAPDAQPDVRLAIAVEQLSPLIMGAVDFRALQGYGLAEISDPAYSGVLQRLFLSDQKPICLTEF